MTTGKRGFRRFHLHIAKKLHHYSNRMQDFLFAMIAEDYNGIQNAYISDTYQDMLLKIYLKTDRTATKKGAP